MILATKRIALRDHVQKSWEKNEHAHPPFAHCGDRQRRIRRPRRRAGQIDRGGLDHLDAGFRPVRPHPADVQGQDRHRREGGGAGHRTGARYRAPRRCRRGVRPRKARRRKVSVRRLWRQALSRDVQRLHPDRPEGRSGRHQGHEGHRRSARRRSRPRAPTSSRAATSPAPTRPRSTSGRLPASTSRRTRALVQGDRAGHGRGAEHRVGLQRLCARRSRHLAVVQEPRRSRRSRSKATSGCSTSMASCW